MNYKGYEIEIKQDENVESPREWDNMGKMICFHRNYRLGDKHSYSTDDLKDTIKQKDVFSLPLYLYDHGGISISTGSFIGRAQHAQWDSGCVGAIIVTYEDIRKEYNVKKVTKKILEKVEKQLKSEVETYDQFLTGDVYGYEITKDGEDIDSCWGFYGRDNCEEEAKSIVDSTIQHETKNHLIQLKEWIKNKVELIYRKPMAI